MVTRTRLRAILTAASLYAMAALLIGYFGVNAYTGAHGLKAQQDTDSGMGAAADLAGTQTTIAITDDNKLSILDVRKPLERYVRCVAVRGGATGAVLNGVLAFRYRPKTLPVTQGRDVAIHEKHLSPAEGAA